VSFAAKTLCVALQRVFVVVVVYFVTTQSGNFWTHPRIVSNIFIRSIVFEVWSNVEVDVMNTWKTCIFTDTLQRFWVSLNLLCRY